MYQDGPGVIYFLSEIGSVIALGVMRLSGVLELLHGFYFVDTI
jgi:hypothetical protein